MPDMSEIGPGIPLKSTLGLNTWSKDVQSHIQSPKKRLFATKSDNSMSGTEHGRYM